MDGVMRKGTSFHMEWVMNRLKSLSFVLLTVLAGCASTPSGPVRIDGSSPRACERSWKRLESSLNGQQRQQLELALLLIGSTKQLRLGTLTTSPGISPETVREEIDGKDFEEIVALAKATGAAITNVQHPVRN
jgi:hypothetical protein